MELLKINDPAAFVAGLTPAQKAELDKILEKELHEVTYGDPEWRIDNLYWIQDQDGKKVRFVRNAAQRQWWGERWYLNVILKARQLGFSTEIALEMLDECLFTDNFAAGIIDYSVDDAKKKLDKIKFAYDNLPEHIRAKNPLVKENTENLEFANGSRIEVGTSHRGGTLQHLHVSEYGKISAVRPDKAKEIKKGGFGTVHAGQRIDVESTAEGIGGEFHDMVQRAEALAKEGRPLSQLNFKLHFFAWWQHPGYVLDPKTVRIGKELEEYFLELETAHKIKLSAEQRAWYAAKQDQIGLDGMYQEYPSYPEEAFKVSIDGAYFKRQMTKARVDGRISRLPHDEMRLVNTFWDIGNDTTSIWFHQTDGVRHRLIDYYENADESIAHYVMELQDRHDNVGYRYGKHYGPHDLVNKEWGGSGKTRFEIAESLGVKFTVVRRIEDKNDAIDAARLFLGMCWFDEKYTEQGIRCLDNYRKKWNEQLATWSREPLHNWASHGADSFMTGALGYKPEKKKVASSLPTLPTLSSGIPTERGTGWMGKR
jgi:hypothetical protein